MVCRKWRDGTVTKEWNCKSWQEDRRRIEGDQESEGAVDRRCQDYPTTTIICVDPQLMAYSYASINVTLNRKIP